MSSLVTVTPGGFQYVRAAGWYYQTVTVRNTSSRVLSGIISLVFDNLPTGVTLYNRSGYTRRLAPLNSPYLYLPASLLEPGQSVSATLIWSNPSQVPITYTPRVLTGPVP